MIWIILILKINNMNEKYTGWLVSTSLIQRSLAVLGHYILWYIIIIAWVWIVFLFVAMVAWIIWMF